MHAGAHRRSDAQYAMMIRGDEGGVAEAPVVEVADHGHAARGRRDEHELHALETICGNDALALTNPDDTERHHADDPRRVRSGQCGMARDGRRRTQPTAALALLTAQAAHAVHERAINLFTEPHRP